MTHNAPETEQEIMRKELHKAIDQLTSDFTPADYAMLLSIMCSFYLAPPGERFLQLHSDLQLLNPDAAQPPAGGMQ